MVQTCLCLCRAVQTALAASWSAQRISSSTAIRCAYHHSAHCVSAGRYMLIAGTMQLDRMSA